MHRSSCTIIDCLWIKQQKAYYVLDVLAWSNQSLINCDVRIFIYKYNGATEYLMYCYMLYEPYDSDLTKFILFHFRPSSGSSG